MFIPPKQHTDALIRQKLNGEVTLKSSHLCIEAGVATPLFGDTDNVCLVYYPNKRSLLIACSDDQMFRDLHKTKQHILKRANANGNRTIALHELLIDNDIFQEDRVLTFVSQPALGILNVSL